MIDITQKKTIEDLILALTHENWQVRADAAHTLGNQGDPRAVEPLLEVLADQSSMVREQAVIALGLLGDPRAVIPILERIDLEEDVDKYIGIIMFNRPDDECPKALREFDLPLKQKIKKAHELACDIRCTEEEVDERLKILYDALIENYHAAPLLNNWVNSMIEAWER